ncbi:hypothetical protein ACFVT5_42355 [Streptomyces sp. NPDC058001]|uniref:hypothetical protein n=1 Tax=Streptomyces sp. NPDC058001 TaxID=3346300 RepID=UPI0036E794F6
MENPGPLFRRRLLIDSLLVVAADASVQVSWLVNHGVSADEITLDFDHACRMAERLAEAGHLDHQVLPGLREIDTVFSEMSGEGNADRWTEDALSSDEGWNQARRLARRVLDVEVGGWDQPLPEITVIR